jgi:LysM repeat protein/GTPase SAR1 family protein
MDETATKLVVQDSAIAQIEGDIHGQVIVGDKNLQIGSIHGGIVNLTYASERPRLQSKATPVFILPRRFNGLLDRSLEVESAVTGLSAAQPVEFYGPGGVGKTSLMRYLARHPMTQNFPDGVIYLSAADQLPGDLLQSIFDAFFEFNAPYKPSQGEMRQALQAIRALILLDDVDLERHYLESLLDYLPESNFLLTAGERHLWGESKALPLQGLPEKQALELFVRELGHPLEETEVGLASKLCQRLRGFPLYIIQAAALVREQDRTLIELANMIEIRTSGDGLAEASLEVADPSERRVLAAIGTLAGAPLHERHLATLTQVEDVEPVVQRLVQRGLILAHTPGYTLSGGLQAELEARGALDRWRVWTMDYFHSWVEERFAKPDEILADSNGLTRLAEWALKAGEPARALKLARGMEGALAVGRRWDAWNRVLHSALEAAQALEDLPAKAWALHQIGTRALCLGENAVARRHLIRAFILRQSIGDWVGSKVTRHNLDLLLSTPSPPEDMPPDPPSPGNGSLFDMLKSFKTWGALVSLVAVGFVTGMLFRPPSLPPPPVETSPAATQTQILPTQSKTKETPTATQTEPVITPSPTAEPSPTITFTSTPTETQAPSPTSCLPRTDWPVYTVQWRDTLWSISQATGTSVRQLQIANCLDGNLIRTGMRLRVPRLPPPPPTTPPTSTNTVTLTPTSTATETPTSTVENYPPRIVIERPSNGSQHPLIDRDQNGWYAVIQAYGIAIDPEDGVLPDQALVWSDGSSGKQIAQGSQPTIRLYTNRCQTITKSLALTATDSQNLSSTLSYQVTLEPHSTCSPIVQIQEPRGGTYYYSDQDKSPEGYFVTLHARVDAYDALGDNIPETNIHWKMEPIQGSGTPVYLTGREFDFTLTAKEYCIGATYRIEVTGSDQDGNIAQDVISVTIKASSGSCSVG